MKRKPEQVIERYDKLKSDRAVTEETWQDISDYLHPIRNDINNSYEKGQRRRNHLLDNTGITNKEELAANLHFMLTNPNVNWLTYTTGFPELDRENDVAKWLEKRSNTAIEVINASNFHTEIFQYFEDLASLCTAGMFCLEDNDDIISFLTLHLGNFCIDENNKGMVDEVYREFEWTLKQIVQEFGEEVLEQSEELKRDYKEHSSKEYKIVHAIYPNMDPKSSGISKDFISQYVIKDLVHGNQAYEVSADGFNESPYIISRWKKAANEVYGRGPGWTALPEMKILNEMTKTTIKGAQKTVDPPVQVQDDGVTLPLRLVPGGVTFRRPGAEPIQPIFDNYRVDFGLETMEAHRKRIKGAFFTDKLQLPERDRMTAEEISAHMENNGKILGPLLGRQEREFLTPLINRVDGILERRGLFDSPPEVMNQFFAERKKSVVDLKPRYKSFLSRTQKAAELNKYIRAFGFIGGIADRIPDVIHNLDSDTVFVEIMQLLDITPRAIRKPSDVKKIRDDMAKRAEQESQEQSAMNQSQVAKNVAPLIQQ